MGALFREHKSDPLNRDCLDCFRNWVDRNSMMNVNQTCNDPLLDMHVGDIVTGKRVSITVKESAAGGLIVTCDGTQLLLKPPKS